jgi:dolichol-phosphate mannosyltransferase
MNDNNLIEQKLLELLLPLQKRNTIFIIIPVFNEKENIVNLSLSINKLCKQLQSHFDFRILFIDDGSRDSTVLTINSTFWEADKDVISFTENCGPGKAFSVGFKSIIDKLDPTDWVLSIEGDGTSDLNEVPKMLIRALIEDYDLILASPYSIGGGMDNTNAFRKLLSVVGNSLARNLLGLGGIWTISSFFRLHKGLLILKSHDKFSTNLITLNGFEGVVEYLMKFKSLSSKISEYPINVNQDLRQGKSKMKVVKTVIGYFKLFLTKSHF